MWGKGEKEEGGMRSAPPSTHTPLSLTSAAQSKEVQLENQLYLCSPVPGKLYFSPPKPFDRKTKKGQKQKLGGD